MAGLPPSGMPVTPAPLPRDAAGVPAPLRQSTMDDALQQARQASKSIREFDKEIAAKGAQVGFAPLFEAAAAAGKTGKRPKRKTQGGGGGGGGAAEIRLLQAQVQERFNQDIADMRQGLVAAQLAGSSPGPGIIPAKDLPEGVIPKDTMLQWIGVDVNKIPKRLRDKLLKQAEKGQ